MTLSSNDRGACAGLTRRTVMAAATVLALALPAHAQSWDEVVAAAKKEGKIVFYNNLQPNGIEPLLQKFREAYPGIQTEQIRLGSNPLIERFQTEFTAGRHLADVLLTFPDERIDEGFKQGWALQWTPPELPNFPPDINRQNMGFVLQQSREAIIWNKNLVRDANAPKEWADLFDPKSGTTTSANVAMVAKNAPNPNAAKVFVNWLMTEQGQKHLQQYAGLSVTRKGVPPLSKLPATSELSNVVDG